MPIKVKHEGDIGALLALAFSAGGATAKGADRVSIPSSPISVSGGGGGGGGRATRMGPTGQQGPLSYRGGQAVRVEEMQRAEQWERRNAEEREAARQQEEQAMQEAKDRESKLWVEEFSPQTKQKIAKDNNAIGEIRTQVANGDIPQSDGERMIDKIRGRRQSYQTTWRPRNSGDPQPPQPGMEPGKLWVHPEFGGLYTTDPSTMMPKVVVRPDQMPQYRQMELKADQEKAILEREQKREDRILGMREALGKMQIKSKHPETGREETGFMKQEKIDEILGTIYRDQAPEKADVLPWWERARLDGVSTTADDRELPESVGYSQAWLRHMSEKYKVTGSGDWYQKIPLYHHRAWEEASRVIREHQAKQDLE